MSRGLAAAVANYVGPFEWGVDLTLRDGTVRRYATDDVTFLGNSYQSYLRVTGPVRQRRTIETGSAEIELLNADLAIGTLIETQEFEGALCILKQLQLGIDQEVEIFRGILSEQDETEEGVRFRVVSELDPSQRSVPARDYAQLCTWRFTGGICRYDPATITFVENLAQRTADIFSLTTIGDSTLAEAVNAHRDRWLVITDGLGKDQARHIKSNTATTFTLYGEWETIPDGTSRFKVFTFTNGAPKLLATATSGDFERTATSGGTRFIEDTGLSMATDEHADDLVRITGGTGSGQQRKIGSNTGVRITIASAEPDFSPAPDATSVFRVFYRKCPKDLTVSCEQRARNQDFNGFPTLTGIVQQRHSQPPSPRDDEGRPGGGGGGGGRHDPLES